MWNTENSNKIVTSRIAGRKKILTLAFLAFTVLGMQAQNFEVGVKGSYKSTWLFNNNISDQGDVQDYAAGWGYNYGLGFNYYFNDRLGMGIDVLMNHHTGHYAGTDTATHSFTSWATINSMDIPVMFKMRSDNGGYLEVGPMFSSISSTMFDFNQEYTVGTTTFTNNFSHKADSNYAKSNICAVLGFGTKIKLGGHFLMQVGFRLEYGLTDLKGLDAYGISLRNALIYPTKASTNSAAAGLMVGFVYSFGTQVESSSKNPTPPPPPPPPPPGN